MDGAGADEVYDDDDSDGAGIGCGAAWEVSFCLSGEKRGEVSDVEAEIKLMFERELGLIPGGVDSGVDLSEGAVGEEDDYLDMQCTCDEVMIILMNGYICILLWIL